MSEAFGLPVSDLPEGTVPIEVVGAVKVLGADGNVELWGFQTEDVTFWEAVGMLRVALRQFEQGLFSIHFLGGNDFFIEGDDEEEDDDD